MPHLTIDHSSRPAGAFDACALVKELHPLVIEESGSSGVCKTLVRPVETYAGEVPHTEAFFVHVEIGLMPGRSEARKARLSERVLALLARHVPGGGGTEGQAVVSVEVRDLAGSYRLSPSVR
ncbi:5-carboxymethyl-2-hydroxymuconate delta isomerase [Streptomyces yokosukanensis]|uniref:5-carboxymethyl-2-hydroxymuconate delta isomerase n=1 Tax=Streptomyces yokosukanensis TaxID=67386 RepID=A0A101NXT3_9ACTN|nr:5-carboxymethyl-2-hydroxymuconate delta isomerase [Streptomyces yokosukanensis]KUN01073.1 5-carboxymethyl-2-hydroxymuconate delta isomerase [Streptomyces yokosukanensis]